MTKPEVMPGKAVRVPAAPPILLLWLLLAALLAAAVSYSQGTRYALVTESGAALSAVPHAAVAHFDGDSPRHHACCDRYPASRSEPAPTKAGAAGPPATAVTGGAQPALAPGGPRDRQPRRQALTLDQLSISRT